MPTVRTISILSQNGARNTFEFSYQNIQAKDSTTSGQTSISHEATTSNAVTSNVPKEGNNSPDDLFDDMDLEFTTSVPTDQEETSEVNVNSNVRELQDLVLTEDQSGKGVVLFVF